ncbi:MAG: PD-(D/E)XK nuclease family protein [Woeseia sp.]
MYQWLSDAVEDRSIVVTASRRLARVLKSEYDDRKLANDQQAWLSADIQFLDDWLIRTVNAATRALPSVLSDNASSILWERCLTARSGDQLLNTGMLVRQARQSWQRLQDWRVPLEEVTRRARSEDERFFASAAREYRKMLADNDWIDSAQVAGLIAELIADSVIPAPESVVHAGFDRLVPAVERLFSVLSDRGCRISAAGTDDSREQAAVTSFDDTPSELRAAGAWARRELSENPSAKIGIVYLALHKHAAAAERYVREGIAPGWQYGSTALRTAVNTSYGRRLADYPAIAVALLALRWAHRGLSFKEISPLLRSKFIAGDSRAGRSRLELHLRGLPDQSWSPNAIVRLFRQRTEETDAIEWVEGIERLAKVGSDAPRQASPVVWAETIDELMRTLRWPGTAALASDEFQLVNRWRELLNDLAKLETVRPKMTFAEANRRLEMLANDNLFQPESESASMQLLGPLEAAGMRFDHLWVAGLDGNSWPPMAYPLALVSRQLQKQHSMPDATPDDTLDYSRRVLSRLVRSAEHVRLSWARSVENSENAASPLIAGYTTSQDGVPPDPGWHAAKLVATRGFERPEDDRAPAVQNDETLAGGAYSVQRQATNPFSAFAFGRLRVTEIEPVTAGLSPKIRGSLLHAALHALYSHKPSQAEIRQWICSDARKRIKQAIDSALREYLLHADEVLRRILALEHDRLCNLLLEFVAGETRRSTFQVESVERDLEYQQFGLHLKIRPDRIDRLCDDSLLIADYKSGLKRNLVGRSGDIKELQLAVYACAVDEMIGALALINVGSRSIDYDSAGGSEEWDAKRADQWPERLCAWRKKVARAIEQIAAGDSRINLNLKTSDARPLNILCRFEERRRA